MRTHRLLPSLMMAALLAGSALLVGCDTSQQGKTLDSASLPSPPPIEERLKKIDADPNMPPAAKEAAKASLLSHQNQPPQGKVPTGQTPKTNP